ncbi:MAG TPA: family 10 glycosylhydrolase [Bacteroidota bacterium]|nr:family 10 glycosylhydrolase [Bacteroidota bacterium]
MSLHAALFRLRLTWIPRIFVMFWLPWALGAAAGDSAASSAPSAPADNGREVRAVWIATVGGLDWPSTYDTARQRASLAGMIDRLSRAGFNTVFFQVRGRGDAVYRPGAEPWSHVMTGVPGADPGWDPLAFAVAEAHAHGMEIHAWFNTYLVRGVKTPPGPTVPPHLINAHRDWVRLYGDQWWLDPGDPEVERHLTGVALDIVSRYDIDGLQMDYIRYPGKSFDDDATYKKFGRGLPRDRWRRENVTGLLTRIKDELGRRAPAVKFGVTPVGIYLNPRGVRGLESYSDVFQDSYDWVRRGIVDYVAPQLYWPIGGDGRDPDFSEMVREWRRESPGRHLYAGIASYKPEVLAQWTRPVEVAREAGADGEAFFRYGNLEGKLPLGEVYSRLALPPPMRWKDSTVPAPPESLRVATAADGVSRLSWRVSSPREICRFVAVYRIEESEGGTARDERLIAVLPREITEYSDPPAPGRGARYSYAVSVVSRSGIESPPAGTGPALAAGKVGPALASPPAEAGTRLRVGIPSRARGISTYFIPFTIASGGRVTVSVADPSSAELLRVFEGEKPPGGYVVSVDMSGFGEGRYRCSVRAGGDRIEREILIRK